MKITEKLAELYPTAQSLTTARKNYSSWEHMAKCTGVGKGSLHARRKVLGMPRETNEKETNMFADRLTSEEIDQNIRLLLQGVSKNIVKVYGIVKPDLFYLNQRGYRGLKFIREDKGVAWNKVCHDMMPYPILGRV